MQQIHRLLEGIKLYGLENVSTLSEYAGLPIETTRYMVWSELPRHRVHVGLDIDLEQIGLQTWILQLEIPRNRAEDVINALLSCDGGITYLAKIIPTNTYIALLAIPSEQHQKLQLQLERLLRTKAIQKYSLTEVRAMRYVSVNPSFYNFKKGEWEFEWKSVGDLAKQLQRKEAKPAKVRRNHSNHKKTIADYKDILLLKEFQNRIPRSISKLTKVLGIDQFNLRYHYNNHVKLLIRNYYIRALPKNHSEQASFIFFFHPSREGELAKARAFALALPFTIAEWESENAYFWQVSCPGEFVSGLMRYLGESFGETVGKLDYLLLDSTSEVVGTIPFRLWDQKKEGWSYEPKISLKVFNVEFDLLKQMCKYESNGMCSYNKAKPQRCEISACPFVKA